jgi:hypothetical protein
MNIDSLTPEETQAFEKWLIENEWKLKNFYNLDRKEKQFLLEIYEKGVETNQAQR